MSHKEFATMDADFPDVRNLDTIVESIASTEHMRVQDTKFLKKMNAHDLCTGKTSCKIQEFVTSSRKRKGRDSPSVKTDDSEKTISQQWKCDTCNVDLLYNKKEAQRVCPSCGKTSFFQEMTRGDMISQGYTPTTAYLYKRHNHFKTWLKRTQGKETTTISDDVVDLVCQELRKERITDMEKVDHHKIKAILKKLRQNKYYNHCVQITTIITGKVPPQMTQEQEDSLLQMFERVQEPFEKMVMGKTRQNMLSYSYLIHKFLQILGLDEFLPYFPLLVSQDKIHIQDSLWKILCDEVQFEFIRSTM